MASLSDTADASQVPAKNAKPRFGGDFVEGFSNLNLVRQVGLMIGLAASVAIGFAVVLWSQGEDYRPLYGSLDNIDASSVIEILEQNKMNFKLRSEEHTSELQSRPHLVCRLLLEKKKQ